MRCVSRRCTITEFVYSNYVRGLNKLKAMRKAENEMSCTSLFTYYPLKP